MDGCGYMELKAYAKINLSIDVIDEREDGYHEVSMIMQSIELHDILKFKKSDRGIRIYCSSPYVPCDKRNIVFKALELVRKKYNISSGMEIQIEKRIPVAAGLGGGSSDAASAIIAANKIWNLELSNAEMMDLGGMVGADVPFCIKGGTALARGIGEKITELPSIGRIYIVLAKPPVSVSTREIYNSLKMDEIVIRPDTQKLVKSINDRNIKYVADNMINVLESVTIKKYPVIDEIKSIMVNFGALGSMMSGSGPTVFGIFEDDRTAEVCYNRLRDYMKDVYITETI